MSIARFRSALASTCISLAAAATAAGGVPVDTAALALEVELAKRPEIYLVVDVGREVVEIKARGVVLDQARLLRAAMLAPAPLLGGGDPPEPELPAVWRVNESPADLERRVVAPETLEPYSEESAQAEPAAPTATPTPVAGVRHPRFAVLTDAGWRVALGPGVASTGLHDRLGDGIRHLWLQVTGSDDPRPPVLALDLGAEDADKLHHLFRVGTALLIVPPAAASAQGSGVGDR